MVVEKVPVMVTLNNGAIEAKENRNKENERGNATSMPLVSLRSQILNVRLSSSVMAKMQLRSSNDTIPLKARLSTEHGITSSPVTKEHLCP